MAEKAREEDIVKKDRRLTPYEKWIREQDVYIYGKGHFPEDKLTDNHRAVERVKHREDIWAEWLPDAKEIELTEWDRMGGRGAFIKFWNFRQFTDAFVVEIPPNGALEPQKHLWELQLYALSGKGTLTIGQDEEVETTLEWEADDMFAIPLNFSYQLYNTGDEPAKLLGISTAPSMINAFSRYNMDFVLDNDFEFTDRYSGEDFFEGEEDWMMPEGVGRVIEANYLSKIGSRETFDVAISTDAGGGFFWQPAENALVGHVATFEQGAYTGGHKHPWSTGLGFVIPAEGEGFTLLWNGPKHWSEAEFHMKLPYKKHTVWTFDSRLWHEHFNVGETDDRYYAWYLGSKKWPGYGGWFKRWGSYVTTRRGGWLIPIEDQDPRTLEMFQEELETRGIEMKDLDEWYGDQYQPAEDQFSDG